MKFDSKAGQELRTWILFFVGIALVLIFAINGAELNPWWTIIIGAFTCTAVLVSAVSAITGGPHSGTNSFEDRLDADPESTTKRGVHERRSTTIFSVLGTSRPGTLRLFF